MMDKDANPAAGLLADLIRCPSVTPEEAGVLDVVEAFLAPLGFACTRLRFEGQGSYPVDNLFATRGHSGRHLLFAGHTDVVPPGNEDAWTHPPFAADVEGGEIWGRGAVDMKSGVAAFCAAVAETTADAGRISLAITNDEEADAINGTDKLMAWTREQGHVFDFALVGEPSSVVRLGDTIKIGRRGSLSMKVTVEGAQGHVAYPDRARNPLPVLARIATALTGAPLDAGTDRFQPSNLELTSIDTGNAATNVIPAAGTLRFNVRFNDAWDTGRLEDWIGSRIASVDPQGCSVSVEGLGRVSPCFLSPVSDDVRHLVEAIGAATGMEPELSTGGGTSDARFISQYCPVVEFGLVGATMHQIDERASLGDVGRLTGIYRDFIHRFFAVQG
jgi:succinyl-diaminopimelate desuccinylase